jgi:hypothetical protein
VLFKRRSAYTNENDALAYTLKALHNKVDYLKVAARWRLGSPAQSEQAGDGAWGCVGEGLSARGGGGGSGETAYRGWGAWTGGLKLKWEDV